MTTLTLIAAVLGALIPPVVIAMALRSKAKDRWPEGLLVGVYLGALGAVSVVALLNYFM
jgi:NhaP-type Na+/H+ and K+/H+ antiporter